MLSDLQLQTQFEDLSLPAEYFDHTAHLRIAWIYLNQFALEIAVNKICDGIQLYATHLGAKDKFHRTISEATAYLIHQRMLQQPVVESKDFIALHEDLKQDLYAVLLNYYSAELLESEQAKLIYMQPDIAAIKV